MMTQDRMKAILDACDKLEIELASDPVVLGPTYLQNMIATCRNYTNNVVNLLNEVRRAKMVIDVELRRKQALFKVVADEYLAKNLAVRNLPNIKDREAQVNLMLKDEHREIVTLENDKLDLEHVEDMVKLRHRELKDTMREIQTQRGLIRDEYETGAMYGDERPSLGEVKEGRRPRQQLSDDDIAQLMVEGLPEEVEPEPKQLTVSSEPQEADVIVAEIVTDNWRKRSETHGVSMPKRNGWRPQDATPIVEVPAEVEKLSEDDEFSAFLAQSDSEPKTEEGTPNEDDELADFLNTL
jgi:hypothetical protein